MLTGITHCENKAYNIRIGVFVLSLHATITVSGFFHAGLNIVGLLSSRLDFSRTRPKTQARPNSTQLLQSFDHKDA
jgi:hypothetical protein